MRLDIIPTAAAGPSMHIDIPTRLQFHLMSINLHSSSNPPKNHPVILQSRNQLTGAAQRHHSAGCDFPSLCSSDCGWSRHRLGVPWRSGERGKKIGAVTVGLMIRVIYIRIYILLIILNSIYIIFYIYIIIIYINISTYIIIYIYIYY